MKPWQIFVPVALVMTAAFVLEKRSHDAQLAQLRGDVALLHAQTTALGRAPERGVAGQASPARVEAPAQMRERFDAIFAQEPPDSLWSDSAERLVHDRLRAALPAGSELISASCKSTFCRIETTHPDRAHFTQFVDASFKNRATSLWNGAAFSSLLGSPSVSPWHVVSYLARDGRDLPFVAVD